MKNDQIKLQKIKAALSYLAEYYFQSLTEKQIVLYADDLMQLSLEEIESAMRIYRIDVANEKFPLPSKLIEIARPSKKDPKKVGDEVASRILKAVRSKGYTWAWIDNYKPYPSFKDAFIAKLGDLAWEVVNLNGSWQSLCETEMDEGVLTAQLRDRASALYSKALSGDINSLPMIPKPRFESSDPTRISGTLTALLEDLDKK